MTEDGGRRHVEKMLEESGFPLEIEFSSFLEEKGWIVASSVFFQDLDFGIPREVDLIASKTLNESSDGKRFDPYVLNLTLIIECKKSQKYNWVFYPRATRRTTIILPDMPWATGLLYTDFAESARTRSLFPVRFPSLAVLHEQRFGPLTALLPPTTARQLIDTQQMGITDANIVRCLSTNTRSIHHEEVPQKNRPDDLRIYEVARTLWKAAWDEMTLSKRLMNAIFESISRGYSLDQIRWPIHLFLPIVIFDGPMWKWDEKERRVDEIDETVLQVELSSPNYPSPSALICVANKNRAFGLITEIQEDLLKISDLVCENATALDRQREIIVQGLRTPPM